MDPYVVGLAVAGWLATTWLAFRWGLHSKALERQEAAKAAIRTRRREFCSFLRGWKADFDRLHIHTHGYTRLPRAFSDTLPSFVRQADMVAGDLSGEPQRKFRELAAAIAGRRGADITRGDRYKELLKDFDSLLNFFDNDAPPEL